jgi:voltage-gated potassium channel Kch
VMEFLGLSTALGAFIAGVMLADSPYRHELEADVEPFRSILLGLFFLAVGMMLDLHTIAERPFFVIGMALGLVAIKTLVIFGIGKMFGMKWRAALALGMLLSQGGEFGFVLFTQAQHALLIAPEAASLFGAIVTVSMAATPFLMKATKRMREEPALAQGERAGPENADRATAIVVGYGRFGQSVAQMLNASDISVTMIDTDIEMIDVASSFGAKVYFGDGTRLDLLRLAGADEASMILFCMDGDQLTADAVEAVHHSFPQASLYVRAYDRRAVIRLKKTPASCIVREVMESAVRMARIALEDSGVSIEAINRAEEMYRARDRERLKIQIEAGDVRAARDNIIVRPSGED